MTHISPRPGLDPGPLTLTYEAPDQVRGGLYSWKSGDPSHPNNFITGGLP